MASKSAGGLGLSRSDFWVTSKLWINDTNPSDVSAAVSRSLRDLRLSYLDEFVVHWPVRVAGDLDDDFTAEDLVAWDMSWFLELWSAMEAEFRSGRVRTIGVSNLSPLKLTALQYVLGGRCGEAEDGSVACRGGVEGSCLTGSGRVLPATLQVERHPSLAQTDLVDTASRASIAVTAVSYSSFAISVALARRYPRRSGCLCVQCRVCLPQFSPLGNPGRPSMMRKAGDVDILGHDLVQSIGQELGATPAQVLLAWGLATGTSVIPKTTKTHRLVENLGAGVSAHLAHISSGLLRLWTGSCGQACACCVCLVCAALAGCGPSLSAVTRPSSCAAGPALSLDRWPFLLGARSDC
jgi:diketogulonate reductase-like aldo/keto reductase